MTKEQFKTEKKTFTRNDFMEAVEKVLNQPDLKAILDEAPGFEFALLTFGVDVGHHLFGDEGYLKAIQGGKKEVVTDEQ